MTRTITIFFALVVLVTTTSAFSHAGWSDASGNGYDTLITTTPLTYDGTNDAGGANRGTAIDLTTDIRVQVENGTNTIFNPGTESYSISCWYYRTGDNGFQPLVQVGSENGSTDPGYVLYLSSGRPRIRCADSVPIKVNVAGTDVSNDAGWHHLVAVFDRDSQNEQILLYVDNGTATTGSISSSTYNITATGTYGLTIGGSQAKVNDLFTGYMDDIAIYQGVLSATDVSTLYAATTLSVDTITTAGITPVMIHNFEAVPEPSTIVLLLAGFAGLVIIRRRK